MTIASLVQAPGGKVHWAGEVMGETFCGRVLHASFQEWDDDEELVTCEACRARSLRGPRP